ncbi:ISXO2-like domain-containing [Brachionus plicatilis]|uniref:ISXO2-like domain-containing n=1 Tax=Brachionus plicatilis TaxID=10195 RepID=A0A3M7PTH4_BRAPC|nr:ISXO2-like domain-containing [Brachionus plicatilis]
MDNENYWITRLQSLRILNNYNQCICGLKMVMIERKRNKHGKEHKTFRCTNSKCQKYQIIAKNSFFSLIKTSLFVIIEIFNLWAAQISISKAVDLLNINNLTVSVNIISNVFKRLRNLCSSSLNPADIKLGGYSKYVKIDESLVAKTKYHKGSRLKRKPFWMFGMVERVEKGKCFVQIVPNRKAEVLLKIIYDHVSEGTTITSDSWSSYNKITEMKNFKHFSVNHKYNFVDPFSGAHTNKIEGLWKQAKDKLKKMNGCSRISLKSYIDDFLWRQLNTANRVDCYDKILEVLAIFYSANEYCVDKLKSWIEHKDDIIVNASDIDVKNVIDEVVDLYKTVLNHNDFKLIASNKDKEELLLEKFNSLVNYFSMNENRFELTGLNSSIRKFFHEKCGSIGLYHWTKGSTLFFSNSKLGNSLVWIIRLIQNNIKTTSIN